MWLAVNAMLKEIYEEINFSAKFKEGDLATCGTYFGFFMLNQRGRYFVF